jgi:hypothetical protein
VANEQTYICGFAVNALKGLLGGSNFVYQGQNAASAASTITQTFTPCVAASSPNSAITITASDADGSALNAQAWGFQQ